MCMVFVQRKAPIVISGFIDDDGRVARIWVASPITGVRGTVFAVVIKNAFGSVGASMRTIACSSGGD